MARFNVNDILGKLNELRAVFVLGQRAVPFIEEIFFFLKEVSPLLEEINASMMDSALKMPHATSQLQSISEATRTATHEILDLIDEVLLRSNSYGGQLEQTLDDSKAMEAVDHQILDLIRTRLADKPDVIDEIESLFEERRLILHSIEGSVHARSTVIDEIRGQMNRIVMSLQVQDITAQQIASVTHLLDSMRERMAELIERLDAQHESRISGPTPSYEVPEDASFDPNARYEPADERQLAADSLVASLSQGDGSAEGDDTEIDKIFRNAALAMEIRRAGREDEK
jgi:chemotaxis regulatin CheY-phosphate phosphatase CheZ